LTSISIPKSVSTIGYGAFYGNPIDNIVIPTSVKTIEENAFNADVSTNREIRFINISTNEGGYTLEDVKRGGSKYAHLTLEIKLYERTNETANWFDRQKLTTKMLMDKRNANNESNVFNVSIGGNVIWTPDYNNSIVEQTRERYGFRNEYWFNNTFYYEPLDMVVSVECNIKYMWVAVVYFSSGGSYEDKQSFNAYANRIFINKKTNVDEPTGKYRYIQISNAVDSNDAFYFFERLHKVSTNPGVNYNPVIEMLSGYSTIADFQYISDNGGITMTGYKGDSKGVIIPSKINNLPVLAIGYRAFYGYDLTSVTIPNSVTSIGNWAFYSNQLTSVTIPNSITSIGNEAFRDNKLTSVAIPNSVTYIGYYAFAENKLTSVVIPNSVTSIGDYAFAWNQLTSVAIPNSVAYIGNYAFAWNQLTSVAIPNSVTYIGDRAFAENKLTSVIIPKSVKDLDDNAFDEGVKIIRQ
jgi:hypothetical protein